MTDQQDGKLAVALALAVTARGYHGHSVDPDECIECENDHMPCRTSVVLDTLIALLSPAPKPEPMTQEQKKAFSNDWDARYEASRRTS